MLDDDLTVTSLDLTHDDLTIDLRYNSRVRWVTCAIIDYERSEIAKKMGISSNGRYALKVR